MADAIPAQTPDQKTIKPAPKVPPGTPAPSDPNEAPRASHATPGTETVPNSGGGSFKVTTY